MLFRRYPKYLLPNNEYKKFVKAHIAAAAAAE